MTDSLTIARKLRGLGFSVIPLDHPDEPIANELDQRGKTPACKRAAFQRTPPTDDNLIPWFGNGHKRNVGIVCGAVSGIVMVDTDTPEAEQWAATQLPDTPFQTLTAKGRHRFYRHPGGNVPPKVAVREGVDLRGDGSYAVAPGSKHFTGITYRAPMPWPETISVMPVFSMTWFGASAPTTVQVSTSFTGVIGKPIPAGQRNARLTSIAGTLRRTGLNTDAIAAALQVHNTQCCRPPLTELEVGRIAASIGRKPTADGSTALVLTSLHDVLAQPDEAVDWRVDQRFSSGSVNIIGGKPKAGKSTLGRYTAFCIATGRNWLGHRCEAGPVWYLAVEEKPAEVRRHFREMGATGDEPIWLLIERAPEDVIAQLEARAAAERPAAIVLDTMQRCLRITDINDYSEVTGKLDPIIHIARQSGAALILIHHAGKGRPGGDGADLDAILGSTALVGSADNVFLLQRTDRYRLLSSIQRIGPDLSETVVQLDEAGCLSLGLERYAADARYAEDQILQVLSSASAPLTQAELEDAIECRTAAKRAALKSLVSGNKITRTGTGRRNDSFHYAIGCSVVPYKEGNKRTSNSLSRVVYGDD